MMAWDGGGGGIHTSPYIIPWGGGQRVLIPPQGWEMWPCTLARSEARTENSIKTEIYRKLSPSTVKKYLYPLLRDLKEKFAIYQEYFSHLGFQVGGKKSPMRSWNPKPMQMYPGSEFILPSCCRVGTSHNSRYTGLPGEKNSDEDEFTIINDSHITSN